MKIHYYSPAADSTVESHFRNFGDDLNSTLWDQLFPGLLDQDNTTIFSGIGSHLNSTFAARYRESAHVVFGTGYGYGSAIGTLPPDWNVYFVRGPLTADSLGLDRSIAITDAAVLIRLVHSVSEPRNIKAAFMPHVASIESDEATWQTICSELGLHLIDVRRPLDEVLSEIGRSQVLLTEALHGAIVADALRTPWVPFVSNPTISSLKWRDWCGSIEVEYAPTGLPTVWPKKPNASLVDRARRSLKTKLLARTVKRLRDSSRPCLSSDNTIQNLTERLEVQVDQLRRDFDLAITSQSDSSLSVN